MLIIFMFNISNFLIVVIKLLLWIFLDIHYCYHNDYYLQYNVTTIITKTKDQNRQPLHSIYRRTPVLIDYHTLIRFLSHVSTFPRPPWTTRRRAFQYLWHQWTLSHAPTFPRPPPWTTLRRALPAASCRQVACTGGTALGLSNVTRNRFTLRLVD